VNSCGWIGIRPDEPQSFDWFLEKAIALTEFLAVISGSPMAPDKIETYDVTGPGPLTQLIALNERKTCEYSSWIDFFLLRKSMGISLDECISRWLSLYPRAKSAIKLAVSTFANSGRWSHVEFLFLKARLNQMITRMNASHNHKRRDEATGNILG
jgi:hypothetical protein